MGGFKPSRADIAGSTIVGSDKDLDTHAFTGSVDITGSLTLNGSAVTGGGGGGGTPGGATTQIQYNDAGSFAGSPNLTFDGSNLKTTGSLYISSSVAGAGVPLLRLDHAGALDDNPILFVTGSGFVGIGVLEPTYVLQVAASFTDTEPGGTNRAFKVEADNGSEWFSVNGGTISFNVAGGSTKAGGIDLGKRFNIVDVFGTKGALGIGQFPGSPHNVVEVNSANSDQGGDWFVVDQSGSVGIGITNPTELLDVAGTANATTLSIGGTAITSTAAELNLLDSSTATPTAASWGAVERIGVFDIAGSYAGAGGTTHILGTLPAGAVVLNAFLNITAVFSPSLASASEISIAIGTSTTFPTVGGGAAAFLDGAPINALTNAAAPYDANTTLGVLNLKDFGFGTGLAVAQTLKKLPAQENVEMFVFDSGAGTDGGLASSGAKLYVKYIVM